MSEEKQELLNQLQKESTIQLNLSNLLRDTLSIGTQLKANAETLDDEELVTIFRNYIPKFDNFRKDIAKYLAK